VARGTSKFLVFFEVPIKCVSKKSDFVETAPREALQMLARPFTLAN